jgi:hypothetical protein
MTPERLAHLVEIVDRWERAERLFGGPVCSVTLAARELADEVRRLRALAEGWRADAIAARSRAAAPDVCGLIEREEENVKALALDRCAREVLGG